MEVSIIYIRVTITCSCSHPTCLPTRIAVGGLRWSSLVWVSYHLLYFVLSCLVCLSVDLICRGAQVNLGALWAEIYLETKPHTSPRSNYNPTGRVLHGQAKLSQVGPSELMF